MQSDRENRQSICVNDTSAREVTNMLLKTAQTLMNESQLLGLTITFFRCSIYELSVKKRRLSVRSVG